MRTCLLRPVHGKRHFDPFPSSNIIPYFSLPRNSPPRPGRNGNHRSTHLCAAKPPPTTEFTASRCFRASERHVMSCPRTTGSEALRGKTATGLLRLDDLPMTAFVGANAADDTGRLQFLNRFLNRGPSLSRSLQQPVNADGRRLSDQVEDCIHCFHTGFHTGSDRAILRRDRMDK